MKKLTRKEIWEAEKFEKELKIQKAFGAARKKDSEFKNVSIRRSETHTLARFLSPCAAWVPAVREDESFRSRSYNEAKRLLEFVAHRYVLYATPSFLYRCLLTPQGVALAFGDSVGGAKFNPAEPKEQMYRRWFKAVAQGGSLAKEAKGILTKREAHVFLSAPACYSIDQNLLWAKLVAEGLPPDGARFLFEKFLPADFRVLDDRFPDFARFYANSWADMRRDEREELADFLRAAIADKQFSLKGRTLGSVRKLSCAWHRAGFAKAVRVFRSWTVRYPVWRKEVKGFAVCAIELNSNQALADEGVKQRHCVFSYTASCEAGRSSIFSIRWHELVNESRELSRLTVEVLPERQEVVQIRGRANRWPTDDEMKIVKEWAGSLGLTLARFG